MTDDFHVSQRIFRPKRAAAFVDPMTEDEMLAGVTDALTLCGWRWMHIIRSDGVTAGSPGWPDIVAVHPAREFVLVLELKGAKTPATYDQVAWLNGLEARRVDARIVRPVDYDDVLRLIMAPAESL